MSVTRETLRIGEVAELTGTTPRTIRYYEEIGLLPPAGERELGKHRAYTPADVERVQEILRLRNLLGLSLEQLSQVLAAEDARAEIRRELQQSDDPREQQRLLQEALVHIANQLELVRGRRRELEEFEHELVDKRRRVQKRLGDLSP
jgi:MerR family transcriptional regulator, repressor of the yfmOP operon